MMTKNRALSLARQSALALALLLPSAAPVLAQDADLTKQLHDIAQETATLRHLPPLESIDDQILSRDELLAEMPQLIAEETDLEQLNGATRALIALGLLPPGSDLLDMTVRLMGEQAAGFYDPITDEMIVVADGDFSAEAYYYSHEVVHALQDAYLDPDDFMEEINTDNDDAATAAAALYEGDAVTASNLYLGNHSELAIDLLRESQVASTEMDSAPAPMVVDLIFPYISGEAFVSRLLDDGGWEAVDAAYADLPASTEQILHPEKYLERDQPVTLALPDPAEAMGAAWSLVSENTLGELQTAALLANLQPGEGFNTMTGELQFPEAARNAAAGWGGDRYALWQDASGQEALVWRTAWDTPQDARAFSRALAKYEEQRWSGIFNGESPDDIALVTPDIASRILLDGQEVYYVQTSTLPLADSALAALRAAGE